MPGKRILLTEGEKVIADNLLSLLAATQYNVDLALDGDTGRQLFDQHAYDLALIDFDLPDIKGCDLCRYIRNRNSHFPLMMMSFGVSNHKYEAFEAGVDDYIVLSDDYRELMQRIKVLTKRYARRPAPDNRIIAGDIMVDPDSKVVKKQERIILLSVTEFHLLQYLARNKNRIVSKDEIACEIWGSELSGKEARIVAFINSIRKKLDDVDPKCIHTISGKGYLLAERSQ